MGRNTKPSAGALLALDKHGITDLKRENFAVDGRLFDYGNVSALRYARHVEIASKAAGRIAGKP